MGHQTATWMGYWMGVYYLHYMRTQNHAAITGVCRPSVYLLFTTRCQPTGWRLIFMLKPVWIIWAISRQELALPIHKMRIAQLMTVLRHRGFALTPDQDLVIRIPSEVQAMRMQVISTLRKALLVSFIPQMMCNYALRSTQGMRVRMAASLNDQLSSHHDQAMDTQDVYRPPTLQLPSVSTRVASPTWPYLCSLMVV